ncbi:hypothetical protein ILUMI_05877 [Ignelater luminosus]|uniref:Uncharacterized protein n=1 Tax=Ignelater luminosus TaxID=2038154 RepID=A0A8K0D6W5_IGNLU|nr:hypothetical protein ILUMI_05877 [Ignelater luminosus]
MYQAMTIILACFIQLWDCIDLAVPRVAFLLQDIIPVDIVPLGKSALLQILISAMYNELLVKAESNKKDVKFAEGTKEDSSSVINIPLKKQLTLEHNNSVCSFDGANSSTEAVALAVAEALCSIDEDNKHTEEIDDLLEQAKQSLEINSIQSEGCKRVEQSLQMSEVLVSDLLMTSEGNRSLKTAYHFIRCNYEWLLQSLGVSEESKPFEPNRAMPTSDQLLHMMFHVGYRPFDQLLTGEWQPDWSSLFHIPMGLSIDRIWTQVAMRWEFSGISKTTLSAHDSRVVTDLTALLKPTQ